MDDPYAQLKWGARMMWGLGDYRQIAEALVPEAEWLADAAGVGLGTAMCDVAAGTGNLAVAAAERGARVVASDFSPQMVAWGRERTHGSGLDVTWHEADAEDLPFEDGAFDVVASAFGAMFAPRPEVAAAELSRVAKPGGVGRDGQLVRRRLLWTDLRTAHVVRTIGARRPAVPDGLGRS